MSAPPAARRRNPDGPAAAPTPCRRRTCPDAGPTPASPRSRACSTLITCAACSSRWWCCCISPSPMAPRATGGTTKPCRRACLSDVALTFYTTFAQAFTLAFFFMISSYFCPPAYDKKGPRAYTVDKLKRLGIPFLFYFAVLNPLLVMMVHLFEGQSGHPARRLPARVLGGFVWPRPDVVRGGAAHLLPGLYAVAHGDSGPQPGGVIRKPGRTGARSAPGNGAVGPLRARRGADHLRRAPRLPCRLSGWSRSTSSSRSSRNISPISWWDCWPTGGAGSRACGSARRSCGRGSWRR